MLLLGLASGLPILLIASTLSARLAEAGVSLRSIGLFAYVLAPYTFKFAWAPFIDRLPIPVLTRLLGRRRSWLVVIQAALVVAIWALGQADPLTQPWWTAVCAVAVAFCSASQDIVIDAYRVELLPEERLGAGAAVVVLGYRLGMWLAGAGMLLLADRIGWSSSYSVIAVLMVILFGVTFWLPEPAASAMVAKEEQPQDIVQWFREAVVAPFVEFLERQGLLVAVVILAMISLYRACDVLLTLIAVPFYLSLGFTKSDIAEISGTFGLFVTLIGGLAGGALVYRIGILRALLIGGVLQAGSNLMFAVLAAMGPSRGFFYLTVMIENLSAGLGTAAFVAYLSSLCAMHYTAVQYALLTSFMQMLGKYLIVPSSGFYAEAVGWQAFFISSTLLALPSLAMVWWLDRRGLRVPISGRRS